MTIIVPVDFSSTSENAAQYALQMLDGHFDNKIILYHAYFEEDFLLQAQLSLLQLKERMTSTTGVAVECATEFNGDFIEGILRMSRHRSADAIVMGQNAKNKWEQFIIGSNSIRVVDRSSCPVLIIPEGTTFKPIKNVALCCDFKKVATSIPVAPLQKIFDLLRPTVHIVNVDAGHYVSLSEPYLKGKQLLLDMFGKYRTEFYFIGTYNFIETMNQFIADKEIDVVVTVPKSHGFIEDLVKGSATKKLAFEGGIPLLAVHE